MFVRTSPRPAILAALCLFSLGAASCAADDIASASGAPIGGKADTAGDQEQDPGESEAEPASGFVDAQTYFQTDAEIEAWLTIRRALVDSFDDVCGDTFCEGEYSNFQSLRFRCSVEEQTGALGGCVWVFGASNEDVDPATGEIAVDGQIFTCPMPIAAGTGIADLVEALSGTEPIHAPLPGTEQSLYDGLIGCL
jgi:hypothetical protein